MKKRISKAIAIILMFCVAFSGLPFLVGSMDAHAASAVRRKITLKATVSGQTSVKLKWNKVKKPGSGYAVFRDGKVIKRLSKKKTSFTDKGLEPGSTHKYQIKTYTKKKVTKWYNKKTKKWQTKKPAKKYRGKSKKVTKYTYKKKSNAVNVQTAPSEDPAQDPSDITPEDGATDSSSQNPSDTTTEEGTTDTPAQNPSDTASEEGTTDTPAQDPSDTASEEGTTDSPSQDPSTSEESETSFAITWKDWDGTVLATTNVKKGTIPTYSGTPTRKEDDKNTYTFSGWNPTPTAATKNATYTAQYKATAKPTTPTTPTSQYTYDLKFVNEPYGNGGETVVFLETNNPNPMKLRMNATNSNGVNVTGNALGISEYDDIEFSDDDELFVGNGIPTVFSLSEAGQLTFNVYEVNRVAGTETKVASRTVYVKDYAAEERAWRQSVINEVTTSSMTNKEKMQAICGYLLANFKYTKTDGSRYIYLFADEGIPYWKEKRLNSCSSPAVLVEFGKDIGYPLENWYAKYPEGSSEWTAHHMKAYSAADDTYYIACPATETGLMSRSDIKMFDPDTFKFWGE